MKILKLAKTLENSGFILMNVINKSYGLKSNITLSQFYKSSQNICPIKIKICMHNLNTYSFQNINYEILNPKTCLDI